MKLKLKSLITKLISGVLTWETLSLEDLNLISDNFDDFANLMSDMLIYETGDVINKMLDIPFAEAGKKADTIKKGRAATKKPLITVISETWFDQPSCTGKEGQTFKPAVEKVQGPISAPDFTHLISIIPSIPRIHEDKSTQTTIEIQEQRISSFTREANVADLSQSTADSSGYSASRQTSIQVSTCYEMHAFHSMLRSNLGDQDAVDLTDYPEDRINDASDSLSTDSQSEDAMNALKLGDDIIECDEVEDSGSRVEDHSRCLHPLDFIEMEEEYSEDAIQRRQTGLGYEFDVDSYDGDYG